MREYARKVVRFVKWTIALSLVTTVALLAYALFALQQVDEQIRARIESILASHYDKLSVTVESARLVKGQGIIARRLAIRRDSESAPRAELAFFDEIEWKCTTELAELVASGVPEIKQIIVRRPMLRATRQRDGSWSLADLLPLPTLGSNTPSIVVEGATLQLIDPLCQPPRILTLREINLMLAPEAPTADGSRPPLRIAGQLHGDHLRQARFQGHLAADFSAWKVSGEFEQLELCSELLEKLPVDFDTAPLQTTAARGYANGSFWAVQYADPRVALNFEVTGQIGRGRIDDQRLPYPVTDIAGKFRCNPQGIALEGLTARSGMSRITGNIYSSDFAPNSPMRMALSIEQLLLDPETLLPTMPIEWRKKWFEYQPSGHVDIDLTVASDGQRWWHDIDVTCRDVAFTYHKFPYRLENARGSIRWKDDSVTVSLDAKSYSQDVTIRARLAQLSGGLPIGYVEIRGARLRVDDRLLAALRPTPREVLESLHPQGHFDLFYRADRSADHPEAPMQHFIELKLRDGTIVCDHFPYPLNNISGTVCMRNGMWTFCEDLQGRNADAVVRCWGTLHPPEAGGQLYLWFRGSNVRLDDELRAALPESGRHFWSEMNPRGAIDLEAELQHKPGHGKPRVAVTAWPAPGRVAILPRAFPYAIEDLQGKFVFTDNGVTMEGLSGRHGRTRVSAHGDCEMLPAGGWRLTLKNLAVDQLLAEDRDLARALPPKLRKAIANLAIRGATNIDGDLTMMSEGPDAPLAANWNVNLDTHQLQMSSGVLLENINGRISLVGECRGERFHSSGELAIDSLTYKNLQFTEVRGPFGWNDQGLVLGSNARPDRTRPPQPIVARAYGGTLVGDFWMNFGSSQYGLEARLNNADLARWAREAVAGQQKISGEANARLSLRGAGQGMHNLRGEGSIELLNADIYELPLMVSLLKVLSVRQPDTTAFTEGYIDYKIDGEHVYVNNVRFIGDAISLVSEEGEVNLASKSVRLPFYAVLGRDDDRLPLAQWFLRHAGQRTFSLSVVGTVDEPLVVQQAFPVVSEALEQLQAELQGRNAAPSTARVPAFRAPAFR